MSEERKYSLENLKKAFEQLKEGGLQAKDELQKDGVIQRFEFTFELLWKTLRIFLKEEGVEVNTPKESLKQAFRVGWLTEEGVFAQMLEDRNKTSHVYSKEKSAEIFDRIDQKYIQIIGNIVMKLGKILEE